MKKLMAIILVLVLCAAAGASLAEKTELVVFAAASLTESLTEIKTLYETANPETELVCNFDSSGTLKTQIQEGAVCDVFISAGQKQVNQLDITRDEEKNPERLDFVLEGSRIDLLENKVALVTPADNPRGIKSFDELTELLKGGEVLMAMGNADVPVGQYTQKILAYYGLDEDALAAAGKITYGTNDAFSAGLDVTDTATPEMCGQVIYPAAVMKNSAVPEAAQAFLDYLRGEEAMKIFEEIGFTSMKAEETK